MTLLTKGGRQLDRVTSLADGSYILSVPAPGTYLLAATAPSYGSRARQVTIEDGPLVYDVELPEPSEEGRGRGGRGELTGAPPTGPPRPSRSPRIFAGSGRALVIPGRKSAEQVVDLADERPQHPEAGQRHTRAR